MAGKSLAELGVTELPDPPHTSVKESVFPFAKFPGVDVILGPEMRSTGEVMGIDRDFPLAFAKSQIAAGTVLPTKGTVFISVRDGDKDAIVPVARMLAERAMQECRNDPRERLAWVFRVVTSRPPSENEQKVLLKSFQAQLEHFRAQPEETRKLLAIGERGLVIRCIRSFGYVAEGVAESMPATV